MRLTGAGFGYCTFVEALCSGLSEVVTREKN